MLTIVYAECHELALYAECQYAERCYAECRGTGRVKPHLTRRLITKTEYTDQHEKNCKGRTL